MSETTFDAAPFDAYAERITTGIAMLGGILSLPVLFWFISGIGFDGPIRFSTVAVPTAIAAALFVWLVLNYAVQPTRYEIDLPNERLLIKRRWVRAMRIPFKDIAGVSAAAALADVPRRGLRRSFNAGVFGYHGPFQLESYGRVFFIATNRERLVALARIGHPPLILSPARPRDFVETLRETLIRQTPAESVAGEKMAD